LASKCCRDGVSKCGGGGVGVGGGGGGGWGGWGGGGAPAISGMTIWNLTYQERFSGCSLNATWKEIRREGRYETGGLGKMMKVDEYQVCVSVSVYVCIDDVVYWYLIQ